MKTKSSKACTNWRPQSLAHHEERVLKARDETAKNIVAYRGHLTRVGYVRKTIGTTILELSILNLRQPAYVSRFRRPP